MKTLILVVCFVGIVYSSPINARPDEGAGLNENEDGISSAIFNPVGIAISIVVLVVVMAFLIGCVCCQDELMSIRDEPYGGMEPPNRSTPGTPGLDRTGDLVTIEPLPDIETRRRPSISSQVKPPGFNQAVNKGISAHDWFDSATRTQDFPRSNLQYVRELGRTWFGHVVEGDASKLTPNTRKTKVVVKILREDISQLEQTYFLNEHRKFRDLKHDNVLRLMGKCLDTDPYLLLMEYCSLGDLKGYLLRSRGSSEQLTQSDALLRMCCNTASGLRFLHENNYVHSDFACRNCLVSSDGVVKIGDYGMSMENYKDDYYITTDTAVPVRWWAPESMDVSSKGRVLGKEITRSSNVWSFGVVLWEILEFGKLPYMDLNTNEVVERVVRDGSERLRQPLTPVRHVDRIYEIMQFCFLRSDLRPSMQEIEPMLTFIYQQPKQTTNNKAASPDFDKKWNSLLAAKRPAISDAGRQQFQPQQLHAASPTATIGPDVVQIAHNDSFQNASNEHRPDLVSAAPFDPTVTPQKYNEQATIRAASNLAAQPNMQSQQPGQKNVNEKERQEKRQFVLSLNDDDLANLSVTELVQFYEFLSPEEIAALEKRHKDVLQRNKLRKMAGSMTLDQMNDMNNDELQNILRALEPTEQDRKLNLLKNHKEKLKFEEVLRRAEDVELLRLTSTDMERASKLLSTADFARLQQLIMLAKRRLEMKTEAEKLLTMSEASLAAVSPSRLQSELLPALTSEQQDTVQRRLALVDKKRAFVRNASDEQLLSLKDTGEIEGYLAILGDLEAREIRAKLEKAESNESSRQENEMNLEFLQRSSNRQLAQMPKDQFESLTLNLSSDNIGTLSARREEAMRENEEKKQFILNANDEQLLSLSDSDLDSYWSLIQPDQSTVIKQRLNLARAKFSELGEARRLFASLNNPTIAQINDSDFDELIKLFPSDEQKVARERRMVAIREYLDTMSNDALLSIDVTTLERLMVIANSETLNKRVEMLSNAAATKRSLQRMSDDDMARCSESEIEHILDQLPDQADRTLFEDKFRKAKHRRMLLHMSDDDLIALSEPELEKMLNYLDIDQEKATVKEKWINLNSEKSVAALEEKMDLFNKMPQENMIGFDDQHFEDEIEMFPEEKKRQIRLKRQTAIDTQRRTDHLLNLKPDQLADLDEAEFQIAIQTMPEVASERVLRQRSEVLSQRKLDDDQRQLVSDIRSMDSPKLARLSDDDFKNYWDALIALNHTEEAGKIDYIRRMALVDRTMLMEANDEELAGMADDKFDSLLLLVTAPEQDMLRQRRVTLVNVWMEQIRLKEQKRQVLLATADESLADMKDDEFEEGILVLEPEDIPLVRQKRDNVFTARHKVQEDVNNRRNYIISCSDEELVSLEDRILDSYADVLNNYEMAQVKDRKAAIILRHDEFERQKNEMEAKAMFINSISDADMSKLSEDELMVFVNALDSVEEKDRIRAKWFELVDKRNEARNLFTISKPVDLWVTSREPDFDSKLQVLERDEVSSMLQRLVEIENVRQSYLTNGYDDKLQVEMSNYLTDVEINDMKQNKLIEDTKELETSLRNTSELELYEIYSNPWNEYSESLRQRLNPDVASECERRVKTTKAKRSHYAELSDPEFSKISHVELSDLSNYFSPDEFIDLQSRWERVQEKKRQLKQYAEQSTGPSLVNYYTDNKSKLQLYFDQNELAELEARVARENLNADGLKEDVEDEVMRAEVRQPLAAMPQPNLQDLAVQAAATSNLSAQGLIDDNVTENSANFNLVGASAPDVWGEPVEERDVHSQIHAQTRLEGDGTPEVVVQRLKEGSAARFPFIIDEFAHTSTPDDIDIAVSTKEPVPRERVSKRDHRPIIIDSSVLDTAPVATPKNREDYFESRQAILDLSDADLSRLPMQQIELLYVFLGPNEIFELQERVTRIRQAKSSDSFARSADRSGVRSSKRNRKNLSDLSRAFVTSIQSSNADFDSTAQLLPEHVDEFENVEAAADYLFKLSNDDLLNVDITEVDKFRNYLTLEEQFDLEHRLDEARDDKRQTIMKMNNQDLKAMEKDTYLSYAKYLTADQRLNLDRRRNLVQEISFVDDVDTSYEQPERIQAAMQRTNYALTQVSFMSDSVDSSFGRTANSASGLVDESFILPAISEEFDGVTTNTSSDVGSRFENVTDEFAPTQFEQSNNNVEIQNDIPVVIHQQTRREGDGTCEIIIKRRKEGNPFSVDDLAEPIETATNEPRKSVEDSITTEKSFNVGASPEPSVRVSGLWDNLVDKAADNIEQNQYNDVIETADVELVPNEPPMVIHQQTRREGDGTGEIIIKRRKEGNPFSVDDLAEPIETATNEPRKSVEDSITTEKSFNVGASPEPSVRVSGLWDNLVDKAADNIEQNQYNDVIETADVELVPNEPPMVIHQQTRREGDGTGEIIIKRRKEGNPFSVDDLAEPIETATNEPRKSVEDSFTTEKSFNVGASPEPSVRVSGLWDNLVDKAADNIEQNQYNDVIETADVELVPNEPPMVIHQQTRREGDGTGEIIIKRRKEGNPFSVDDLAEPIETATNEPRKSVEDSFTTEKSFNVGASPEPSVRVSGLWDNLVDKAADNIEQNQYNDVIETTDVEIVPNQPPMVIHQQTRREGDGTGEIIIKRRKEGNPFSVDDLAEPIETATNEPRKSVEDSFTTEKSFNVGASPEPSVRVSGLSDNLVDKAADNIEQNQYNDVIETTDVELVPNEPPMVIHQQTRREGDGTGEIIIKRRKEGNPFSVDDLAEPIETATNEPRKSVEDSFTTEKSFNVGASPEPSVRMSGLWDNLVDKAADNIEQNQYNDVIETTDVEIVPNEPPMVIHQQTRREGDGTGEIIIKRRKEGNPFSVDDMVQSETFVTDSRSSKPEFEEATVEDGFSTSLESTPADTSMIWDSLLEKTVNRGLHEIPEESFETEDVASVNATQSEPPVVILQQSRLEGDGFGAEVLVQRRKEGHPFSVDAVETVEPQLVDVVDEDLEPIHLSNVETENTEFETWTEVTVTKTEVTVGPGGEETVVKTVEKKIEDEEHKVITSADNAPDYYFNRYDPNNLTPMTYDDKKQLSEDINNLSGDQLPRVIEIIKTDEPDRKDLDSDEIEIDFDLLQPLTLHELATYVDACHSYNRDNNRNPLETGQDYGDERVNLLFENLKNGDIQLDDYQTDNLIKIIQSGEPTMRYMDTSDIELDTSRYQPSTLRRLTIYLESCVADEDYKFDIDSNGEMIPVNDETVIRRTADRQNVLRTSNDFAPDRFLNDMEFPTSSQDNLEQEPTDIVNPPMIIHQQTRLEGDGVGEIFVQRRKEGNPFSVDNIDDVEPVTKYDVTRTDTQINEVHNRLTEMLPMLSGQQMINFVKIIQSSEPNLSDVNPDDFQWDFSKLKQSTVQKLDRYVDVCQNNDDDKFDIDSNGEMIFSAFPVRSSNIDFENIDQRTVRTVGGAGFTETGSDDFFSQDPFNTGKHTNVTVTKTKTFTDGSGDKKVIETVEKRIDGKQVIPGDDSLLFDMGRADDIVSVSSGVTTRSSNNDENNIEQFERERTFEMPTTGVDSPVIISQQSRLEDQPTVSTEETSVNKSNNLFSHDPFNTEKQSTVTVTTTKTFTDDSGDKKVIGTVEKRIDGDVIIPKTITSLGIGDVDLHFNRDSTGANQKNGDDLISPTMVETLSTRNDLFDISSANDFFSSDPFGTDSTSGPNVIVKKTQRFNDPFGDEQVERSSDGVNTIVTTTTTTSSESEQRGDPFSRIHTRTSRDFAIDTEFPTSFQDDVEQGESEVVNPPMIIHQQTRLEGDGVGEIFVQRRKEGNPFSVDNIDDVEPVTKYDVTRTDTQINEVHNRLTEMLPILSGHQMINFVKIIQSSEPNLRDVNPDDFQWDFSKLKPSTVQKLDRYVDVCQNNDDDKFDIDSNGEMIFSAFPVRSSNIDFENIDQRTVRTVGATGFTETGSDDFFSQDPFNTGKHTNVTVTKTKTFTDGSGDKKVIETVEKRIDGKQVIPGDDSLLFDMGSFSTDANRSTNDDLISSTIVETSSTINDPFDMSSAFDRSANDFFSSDPFGTDSTSGSNVIVKKTQRFNDPFGDEQVEHSSDGGNTILTTTTTSSEQRGDPFSRIHTHIGGGDLFGSIGSGSESNQMDPSALWGTLIDRAVDNTQQSGDFGAFSPFRSDLSNNADPFLTPSESLFGNSRQESSRVVTSTPMSHDGNVDDFDPFSNESRDSTLDTTYATAHSGNTIDGAIMHTPTSTSTTVTSTTTINKFTDTERSDQV